MEAVGKAAWCGAARDGEVVDRVAAALATSEVATTLLRPEMKPRHIWTSDAMLRRRVWELVDAVT